MQQKRTMNFFYKFSIDRISAAYISGWCFQRINKNKSIELEVRRGGEVIGTARTGLYREDLLALGIHPTGRCGFELVIKPAAGCVEGQPLILAVKNSRSTLAFFYPDRPIQKKHSGLLSRVQSIMSSFGKDRSTVLFMHIPKTAGTSFNTLAYSLFQNKKVATHIELLTENERALLPGKYQFISGHLKFNTMKTLVDERYSNLYSIVREPYAHLHSHIKWLMQTASDTSDNYFKYRNPIIYKLGVRLHEIDFSNVEQLSAFSHGMNGLGIAFFDNLQTRYFCHAADDELVTEEHLQQAVSNTEKFVLIGLTEKYSEYVKDFVRLNNCTKQVIPQTMNRSRSQPLFDLGDEAVRKVLLPLVRYDLELYEFIRTNPLRSSLKTSYCR